MIMVKWNAYMDNYNAYKIKVIIYAGSWICIFLYSYYICIICIYKFRTSYLFHIVHYNYFGVEKIGCCLELFTFYQFMDTNRENNDSSKL